MINRDTRKLLCAIAISPWLPIVTLSTFSFAKAWIPLLFLVGYFSFFLIALPLIAASLINARLLACLSAGAAAAIVPVVLLDSLSLFSASTPFSDEQLQGYGFLLLAGVVGGALFWFVAFSGFSDRSERTASELVAKGATAVVSAIGGTDFPRTREPHCAASLRTEWGSRLRGNDVEGG